MSEFRVEVVRVGEITKHPNADTLGVTLVHGGYPVIVRLGEYEPGGLAVYVPVESVVPADDPRWEFLAGKTRIKAKRLRGIFSMGLLTAAEPGWAQGADVAEALRITRWEPPEEPIRAGAHDDDAPAPKMDAPVYTDIEGLRRWPSVLEHGEPVVITEKIHGENMRAVWDGETLHVGSRTRWKQRGKGGWWRAADTVDLETKLRQCAGVVWYGEAHGYTGGFPYGTGRKATFRAFDAYRPGQGWLDYPELVDLASVLGIPLAPVLYSGGWSPDVAKTLAEGPSTLDPSHVREGIVVRPLRERWNREAGRVIFKLHGEGFLLK